MKYTEGVVVGFDIKSIKGEKAAQAAQAYYDLDFSKALQIADSAIDENPDSVDGVMCRYLRAAACEVGNTPSGEIDSDQSIDDYRFLANMEDEIAVFAHAGIARILACDGMKKNRSEIIMHAEKAIALDDHVPSMVLLGVLYRDIDENLLEARRLFSRAYRKRDYFAGRFWITTFFLEFRLLRGLLATAFFWISAPFLKRRDSSFCD